MELSSEFIFSFSSNCAFRINLFHYVKEKLGHALKVLNHNITSRSCHRVYFKKMGSTCKDRTM
jgi:hypothetical protein